MGQMVFNKSAIEDVGEWWAWGVIRALGKAMLFGVVLLIGLAVVIDLGGRALHLSPPDDTDASWSDRSNLRPRRDALTGCEYIESSSGFLTPRLDATGRQICRPKNLSHSNQITR